MMTSNLCTDIGCASVNHVGEILCGDHVDVIDGDDEAVVVLADGLGSGVKASILSTLTSKMISTMLAAGLKLEDAVAAIVSALPVDAERGVAYSTFTILRIDAMRRVEIIQYDNPSVILLRDGEFVEMPVTTTVMSGKTITRAVTDIRENDLFVALSDGVEHAGVGISYNFGWQRPQIVEYIKTIWDIGFTAKTLATILLDETNRLYDGKPGDDATVCMVKIRARESVNVAIGPPENRDDCGKMMSLFFSRGGKHIVCGGTTSNIAADYLGKALIPELSFPDPNIPPIARIEGVDLVTEGVITMSKVVKFAEDYLEDNKSYTDWCYKKDGASRIARLLFEDATDVNFFVGKAVNPAHQNPDLPIGFNIKMQLIAELSDCLTKMGKKVKVSYF